MDFQFIKIEDIKQEGECCFCTSKEDLFSLLEPYNFEENVEIYSTMIAECFQIELNSYVEEHNKHLYLICKNCIFRLKDSITFRCQIRIAYNRLQAKCCPKGAPGVISSEYSEVIETKEHIPKYDSSEYDNTLCNMKVDSGASLSTENVLESKPLKFVKEENDIKPLENVSIVSANSGSKGKSQPKNVCTIQKQKRSQINKTCKFCDKSFKNKRNLLEHEKIHLGIKDLICDYCKRGFRNKSYLREHVLIHMDIKNKKCDLCDKCFVSTKTLSTHKRVFHSVRFPCDICGKTLSSITRLKYHTLSHSGVKNQKCEICGKAFNNKGLLDKHKQTHFNITKIKNKKCEYCNMEFHTNRRLLEHTKIHLDIKDFICDYCKKGFRRKADLHDHIMIHIGIKNVKCDLCDKRFLCKRALSKHKWAYHSMSLICSVCGLKFKTKRKLTEHTKVHG